MFVGMVTLGLFETGSCSDTLSHTTNRSAVTISRLIGASPARQFGDLRPVRMRPSGPEAL